MKKFAFISRHIPTVEQTALAKKAGIELAIVGDREAFTHNFKEFRNWDGVIVVHAAAAIKCMFETNGTVGVYENSQRPDENGKPQFFASALHLYENTTFQDGAQLSMRTITQR